MQCCSIYLTTSGSYAKKSPTDEITSNYLLMILIHSSTLLKAKNGYVTQSLEFIHLSFIEIYQMMIILVSLSCVTSKVLVAYNKKQLFLSLASM